MKSVNLVVKYALSCLLFRTQNAIPSSIIQFEKCQMKIFNFLYVKQTDNVIWFQMMIICVTKQTVGTEYLTHLLIVLKLYIQ